MLADIQVRNRSLVNWPVFHPDMDRVRPPGNTNDGLAYRQSAEFVFGFVFEQHGLGCRSNIAGVLGVEGQGGGLVSKHSHRNN